MKNISCSVSARSSTIVVARNAFSTNFNIRRLRLKTIDFINVFYAVTDVSSAHPDKVLEFYNEE